MLPDGNITELFAACKPEKKKSPSIPLYQRGKILK
jgi:hypothetical protein